MGHIKQHVISNRSPHPKLPPNEEGVHGTAMAAAGLPQLIMVTSSLTLITDLFLNDDFFICIDDDVFPSPWQLRRLFASLVADPSVPRGLGGHIYDERRRWFVEKRSSPWFRRDQTPSPGSILRSTSSWLQE